MKSAVILWIVLVAVSRGPRASVRVRWGVVWSWLGHKRAVSWRYRGCCRQPTSLECTTAPQPYQRAQERTTMIKEDDGSVVQMYFDDTGYEIGGGSEGNPATTSSTEPPALLK